MPVTAINNDQRAIVTSRAASIVGLDVVRRRRSAKDVPFQREDRHQQLARRGRRGEVLAGQPAQRFGRRPRRRTAPCTRRRPVPECPRRQTAGPRARSRSYDRRDAEPLPAARAGSAEERCQVQRSRAHHLDGGVDDLRRVRPQPRPSSRRSPDRARRGTQIFLRLDAGNRLHDFGDDVRAEAAGVVAVLDDQQPPRLAHRRRPGCRRRAASAFADR